MGTKAGRQLHGRSKNIAIAFDRLPRRYPKVRALVYFDSYDRGVDWPIETSEAAAGVFARRIRKGIYANNRFGELATSPIPPLR